MDKAIENKLINQATDWLFAVKAWQEAAEVAAQGQFWERRKTFLSNAITCLRRRAELLEQVAKGEGEPAPPWRAKIAPEKEEEGPILHGFYSEWAALQGGTVIYATQDGREVEVTGVYQTKEKGKREYPWADKVYVGEVTKWLRDGRLAANGKHRPLSLIGLK